MDNCIFCKIIAGEVPSQKTHHEGNLFVSFPDIHPRAEGHTLLVPVEHYTWFYDMPDELSDRFFRTAKKLARELKGKTGADYVQMSIIGTDVPHVHAHLIPRTFGDKLPAI